ncbi:MAG TPA: DUF3043 domain-containing protein [Frankiaceae bacterium]|nr:DUF3043 domain-containing protein [Frankiaceae bacterium]
MTETEQPPRGKGRPTPKRSEAQKARKQPVVTPRGTAAKGDKRADKAERAAARRRMREAMRTGDERYYPAIAAGPERALVRDVVDARRSIGWLAIPGWFLGLLLTLVPAPAAQAAGTLMFPIVVFILIGDSMGAARDVRKALDARWPDGTKQPRKSLTWYGIARNTQFRRQRMPRPRVERGGALPPQ